MSIRKVTEVASEMRFLCVGSLFTALCSIAVFGQSSNSFLIRDVRVFDGQIVLERRNVVVDAGKVTQITEANLNLPGLRVVDGQGRTLLPGLFDAHVHISEDIDGTLRQALRFGVTTVLDMFNSG